jgi:hypothetical protein
MNLKKMWKEAFMANIKVLGVIKENMKNFKFRIVSVTAKISIKQSLNKLKTGVATCTPNIVTQPGFSQCEGL